MDEPQSEPTTKDIQELRARLRKMSDRELRELGTDARRKCNADPKFAIQLAEAVLEWRRRHPKRRTRAAHNSKSDTKPDIVTGTVELIVTPEMRKKLALERLRRQKARAQERGEVDLGEIDSRDPNAETGE